MYNDYLILRDENNTLTNCYYNLKIHKSGSYIIQKIQTIKDINTTINSYNNYYKGINFENMEIDWTNKETLIYKSIYEI